MSGKKSQKMYVPVRHYQPLRMEWKGHTELNHHYGKYLVSSDRMPCVVDFDEEIVI